MDGVRLLGKSGRFQTGSTLGSAVGTDNVNEEESPNKQNLTSTDTVYSGGDGTGNTAALKVAPQTKGSGFTNIQKILRASGTDTGPSRLAQTAAGGVRQAASGASQALTGAVQTFGEGLKKSNQDLTSTGSSSANIISTASAGGAPTVQDIETVSKAMSGQYGGPTSLQMTPDQQREAAKSAALSRLAGGTAGRAALLQKYVGSPQYDQSKQQLDALLLGRGGSAALRGALRQGAKVEQDIKRQEIVAQEQANQQEQAAKGLAEETKTKLEQAKSNVLNELEETKKQQVQQMSGAVDRVLNLLNHPEWGGDIKRSDLKILGLTEGDLQNLGAAKWLGLDINTYLTGKTTQQLNEYLQSIGKEQFATEAERAKLSALGKLTGEDSLNLRDLGAAYNMQGLSSFDSQKLKSDFIDKLKGFVDVDKYKYDIGKENTESTATIVNDLLNKYMAGAISKWDLVENDPVYKLAKNQVSMLQQKEDTSATRGVYKSGLDHWNEVLANRKRELSKVFNSVKKLTFVD